MGVTILPNVSPPGRPDIKARAAAALVRLGGHLHRALVDLALYLDPRLELPIARRAQPWAGLLIVLLLVAGIALVSGGAVWAIRETVSHREIRP